MQKRGFSQIDWVISLAIFLLYIAWFFIFIRPIAVQENSPNLIDSVNEKIRTEAYWTVFNYPIFVESNFSITNEPIVINASFENESNFFISGKSFFFSMGRLFFLHDISYSIDVIHLIHSNETYEVYNRTTDLVAGPSSASAGGMDVSIDHNLIETADFDGGRIFSYELSSGGAKISPSGTNFSNRNIAVLYPISSQKLNVTTIVFAYNPRIYMIFQGANASVSQSFEIYGYENYFFSDSSSTIVYPACYSGESNILGFYTGTSVMIIALSKEANISFCAADSSITLSIDSNAGSLEQKIIFYEGEPADYLQYSNPYSAEIGIPERTTGISLFYLKLLNSTSYPSLQKQWGVGDFRITVTNETSGAKIIEVGGNPYEKANVYAAQIRDFLLDKYGNLSDVSISIQSWT